MAAISVNQLVTDVFTDIAVYSPGDVPNSSDIKRGVTKFNELLSFLSADGQMIPYISSLTFDLISGKNSYVISDESSADINHSPLLELSECNIIFDDVVLPCKVVPYSNIVNSVRVVDLNAIPGNVYLQRGVDTSTLYFYPAPSSLTKMTATIYGKFALSSVSEFQELIGIPNYMILYLKLELGRHLCAAYPSSYWSSATEAIYQEVLKKIKAVANVDVCIQGDALMNGQAFSSNQTLLGLLPVAGN